MTELLLPLLSRPLLQQLRQRAPCGIELPPQSILEAPEAIL